MATNCVQSEEIVNKIAQQQLHPDENKTTEHEANPSTAAANGDELKESEKKESNNPIESNYFPKGGYSTTEHKLDPIARILLIGVYDDDHPLSIFRGMRYIIKDIWSLAMQFNRVLYAKYIEIAHPYDYWEYIAFREIDTFQKGGRCRMAQTIDLKFPDPLKKEININMMPILYVYIRQN